MMRRLCGLLVILLAAASSVDADRPVQRIDDFTLTDDRGEPWSWQQARGKVALVAFGYTSCPDICPLTLGVVSKTLRELGAAADRVQALFITVDGEHDRAELLHEYVGHFDPRIIGLTGSTEAIDVATRRFGVHYEIKRTGDAERYTIDHSANLVVVAPDGAVAALVPPGLPAEHVARLIRDQLTESAGSGR